MRVYVTGARGFVGRRLVAHLVARGHEAHGAEREVDVCDAGALGEAVAAARPDAIVHLAAQSSVAASFDDPDESFRVNQQGALHLLEAADRAAGDTAPAAVEADLAVQRCIALMAERRARLEDD